MADLTLYSEVDAELAATAGYDVEGDVALAKRRVAALRRKLDFAANSGRDGQTVGYQQQIIQEQLNQALAFIRASESPTEAQLLRNPDVTHADFSNLRGRGSCQ